MWEKRRVEKMPCANEALWEKVLEDTSAIRGEFFFKKSVLTMLYRFQWKL